MQNSLIDHHEKLNQIQKIDMSGSTEMTVEFLRARLLSERSISRTAKQRADELAKRVVDLEEQLKLATLQRRKAEKATSEVLGILENHGINDLSEVYDSSSDQERVSSEPKEVNNIKKEEVDLTTSRATGVEVEETSGLQLGLFPLIGRSLSWKSCSDSSSSLESTRCLDKTRRHSSFISTDGSSTRNHLAKSCRQIKQRETRSPEAEVNDESLFRDAKENVAANRSGDDSDWIRNTPKILREDHKNEEEKPYYGNSDKGTLEDKRLEAKNVLVLDGSERNSEMERALEHQAQLIGQYEAEENAQKEWEEKFKGNNSYSPGDQSDMTEERDENRAETSEVNENQRGKRRMEQGRSPTVDQSQNTSPEFSFPGGANLEAKSYENGKPQSSENSSNYSPSYGSPSFHKGESSSLQVAMHHENHNALGGILDALQRAKLSLQHELHRASSTTRSRPVMRTEPPSTFVDVPVGCAGLFRVPTSSEFEALANPSFTARYPDSELSLSRRYYLDTTQRPTFDPYMNSGMGLPSATRYLDPSFVDLIPRVPSNDGFSRTYQSLGVGRGSQDSFADYNDRMRSGLYKR